MRWKSSPALRRLCAAAAIGVVGGALLPVLPTVPAAGALVAEAPNVAWGVDGTVYATVTVGDVVIVGGSFGHAVSPSGRTVPRRNLAAFDRGTGRLLAHWQAGAGRPVRALAKDGRTVYVGGAFRTIAGKERHRIARIDGLTGAVDDGFTTRLDNAVRAIAVDAKAVYVGGYFTSVDGIKRVRLARLHKSTGALDTRFRANADSGVWGLARNPVYPTLYVSGQFSRINGVARHGVAAVGIGSGAVRPVVFREAARPTLGLDVNAAGTRLFGAGGGRSNAATAWRTATGARVWRRVAMGDVQAIEHHRDTVYFGFHEGYRGDTRVKMLAVYGGNGALRSAFRPRVDSFWGVFAIDATDAGLSVGGAFTRVSGVTARRWAWLPGNV